MVTEFPMKSMLPLNLWSKQSLQAAQAGSEAGAGASASLLAQMQFGHHLAAAPGFLPVSFSSGMFRPGEHAPHGMYSYPALHPSFFRPHLDPATIGSFLNSRGMSHGHLSGAMDGSRDSHPSAFTPAKRLRLDDSHSPGARDGHSPQSPRDHDTSGSSNRTSPSTPIHRAPYSPATSHGHPRIPDMDSLGGSGAEDLRLKFRCDDGEGLRCPICRALLQPGEIRSHLYKEFTSLKETLLSQSANCSSSSSVTTTATILGSHSLCDSESSKSRYDTFLRIRRNRENRLGKMRGDRKRKRYSDEMSHTSATEHDDSIVTDHVTSSPHREPEEETVDVTSCEEPEVPLVYTSTPPPQKQTTEIQDDANLPHSQQSQFTEPRPS